MRIPGKEILAMIVIAIFTMILWNVFTYMPFFRVIENWVQDFRVAGFTPPRPQSDQIVVVTINEGTLELFPFRSPVNRAFLARLIKKLEAADIKAVGVDVLFDTPTIPEQDQMLKSVFDTAKIPIVVSYGNTFSTFGAVNEKQLKYMDTFTSNVKKGFANLVTTNEDQIVRDIYPGWIDNQDQIEENIEKETVITDEKISSLQILKSIGEKFLDFFRHMIGIETEIIDEKDTILHYGLAQQLANIAGVKQFSYKTIKLDYRGFPEDKPYAFARFPAHVVTKLNPFIIKRWFKDKIVLIGADLSAIDLDLHRTPLHTLPGAKGGELPGVVVHAHALSQLLENRKFPNLPNWGITLVVLGMALIGAVLGRLEINLFVLSCFVIVGVALFWTAGIILYWKGAFIMDNALAGPMIPLVGPSFAYGIATFASMAYFGQKQRMQKAFIKDAFSRYLSPALVDELVRNPESLGVKGERRELSMIFTDVAGFTTFSEVVEPEVLAEILNEYLEGVCQIILGYGGTIDKFIGDAVFVIFGAPIPLENHAARAVRCAIDIDIYAENFRIAKNEIGIPFGLTRIGVHTGIATVGNFGSESRFEYTALGDSVNSAARLESLNKQFGTRIAVSKEAKIGAPEVFFRPIASVVVKGKSEPIDIFQPVTPEDAEQPIFKEYCDAYDALEKESPQAAHAFLKLAESYPNDNLTRLHAARIAKGETSSLMILTEK